MALDEARVKKKFVKDYSGVEMGGVQWREVEVVCGGNWA